jgi:ribokinase
MGFGGKGANQAVMAAKLGAQVSMVTKLGKDTFGENTLENFKNFDVDTNHVLFTDQAFSGVAPIAVDKDGNNSIIIVTGANDLLTEEEIEAARTAIASASVLICQLEIPLPITLKALEVAREEGVQTILNPAPGRENLPNRFYELSDVFCPNETEAELLVGFPIKSQEDAEKAGRTFLDEGARTVILTLGDQGSMLITPSETTFVPADVVTAVDTTGAGDAYVGSLAYFIAAGMTLTEAMQRANTVAGISVQSVGTQTSFPVRPDLPPGLFE